jgi:PadR family transcriptional regulator, regulatory protein PadR
MWSKRPLSAAPFNWIARRLQRWISLFCRSVSNAITFRLFSGAGAAWLRLQYVRSDLDYVRSANACTSAGVISYRFTFGAIRKGLLEFLILKIVSADEVYVADMLERLSTTEFATQEGTLYPLLSKMRRDGLVEYVWQESDAGPPRKYYKLTPKGTSQLAELNEYWKSINATVSQLGR